ncbi:MAG TPA: hypothetical protein VGE08_05270, partial [Steroidobacter sp.]
RCLSAADTAGARAVITHAIDDDAVAFYERHGFLRCPLGERTMLMPIAHKIKDEAEAAYQRGTLLVKRAMLMDQWAMFCKDTHPTLISSRNSAGQTA